MKQISFISLFFLLFSCSEPSQKQQEQDSKDIFSGLMDDFPIIDKKPSHQVLTLGVFHFDRSRDGSDVVAKNHIDITTDENRSELDEIIKKLEEFNPSKIAVEWRPEYQDRLDSLFREYLEGNYSLEKNEAFQIGFKLAKSLGHDKVYCVDNNPPMPESINEIDDWEAYADSLGHLELWQSYDQENLRYNTFMDTIQRNLNVKDYLLLINSKKNSVRNKQIWTTGLVNVGYLDKYVGADLLGRWYRRNARIYANSKNLVDTDENLLIIYGGAHKWILDELFESSPDFQVIQFNDLIRN
ncbi:DUF5694 domain-containing protein [Algoriphagus machipongonensis]|uniref:Lipoprotein n=1 Tax=Algoriphagus machipongonensis TaxID=388413 RepID=A3I078_9BACT|nr:DUF5694 domain-containing protein [Algoriphagus machipongonensis]EAZ79874.1 hypothetical protein ALPR1_14634 [Algoriphagus machipongonensis]